jgi:thioredoxin 1
MYNAISERRADMLQTELQHLNTEEEVRELVKANPFVMICCGRMGPMCIPVYEAMHQLEPRYSHVVFRDMDFDAPDASAIRTLPECRSFMGLPFTVYYNNGKVVRATSSIQSEDQIVHILDEEFGEGKVQ